MAANWKAVERAIAVLVEGECIPVNGRRGPDLDTGVALWPDVKSRKQIPQLLFTRFTSASHAGSNMVLFWQSRAGSAGIYALFRVADVLGFYTGQIEPRPLFWPAGDYWPTKKVLPWLEHITSTAPPDKLPCVILHKPGGRYAESLVLAEWGDLSCWLGSGGLMQQPVQRPSGAALVGV